jgi:hypothetical protein
MRTRRSFLVCAAVAIVAVGCAGTGGSRTANITAGEMPSGQSWDGVYYNPVYGYLHMTQQEGSIVARWKRTDQSKWGEMSGTQTGNVVHFTWKEHTYGLVDPASVHQGKGYFVYKIGANDIPELKGEWGNGDDETGNDWNCVKQMNMKPDLNSINGDLNGTAPPAGEHWD